MPGVLAGACVPVEPHLLELFLQADLFAHSPRGLVDGMGFDPRPQRCERCALPAELAAHLRSYVLQYIMAPLIPGLRRCASAPPTPRAGLHFLLALGAKSKDTEI